MEWKHPPNRIESELLRTCLSTLWNGRTSISGSSPEWKILSPTQWPVPKPDALIPTPHRYYLSNLPGPLQSTVSFLLWKLSSVPYSIFTTVFLASWDALGVTVRIVGILGCKSDLVTSLLTTFQWLLFAESKHLFSTLSLGDLAFAPHPDLTSRHLPHAPAPQPFWTIQEDLESHFSPCLCVLPSAGSAFLSHLP